VEIDTGQFGAALREEILTETVTLYVKINGTEVFSRQIYWWHQASDVTGMIVCTVEPSQGFNHSAVLWLEKLYDGSPPDSENHGRHIGWRLHGYDGDTHVWSLDSSGPGTSEPTLIQHSDRNVYLYGFERTWEEDEGGNGGSFNCWVLSYKWNEDREAP